MAEEGKYNYTESYNTYYYCFIPGEGCPATRYKTFEEAEKVARTITEEKAKPVEILKCIAITKVTSKITYLYGEEN